LAGLTAASAVPAASAVAAASAGPAASACPAGPAGATPAGLTGLARLTGLTRLAVAVAGRVAAHAVRTDAGIVCRAMSLPPRERPNFLGSRYPTPPMGWGDGEIMGK
jgi:hypothetical protein